MPLKFQQMSLFPMSPFVLQQRDSNAYKAQNAQTSREQIQRALCNWESTAWLLCCVAGH